MRTVLDIVQLLMGVFQALLTTKRTAHWPRDPGQSPPSAPCQLCRRCRMQCTALKQLVSCPAIVLSSLPLHLRELELFLVQMRQQDAARGQRESLLAPNTTHFCIPNSISAGRSQNPKWMLFGLFFMFSNFYRLHLRNETCAALANLRWSITTKLDWNFSYGNRKCKNT